MTIRMTDANDIKLFMQIKLEMLREVNSLTSDRKKVAFDECIYKERISQTGNCHTDDETFNFIGLKGNIIGLMENKL